MKILFLQEYIRENHVHNGKNGQTVDFKRTEMGKKLTGLLNTIGLTGRDYAVDYVYDMIPEVQKVNPRTGKPIKYKTPTLRQRKEPEERLLRRLMKYKPDIIIPMGEMGCKNLLGSTSITKNRGVPTKKTITNENILRTADEQGLEVDEVVDSFETWVLPMFSMEYWTANPNIENFIMADIDTLGKFVQEGEQAFIPKKVDYEFVDNIERVRQIFGFLDKTKPVTAWDLETNSLRGDLLGAKPLVMSMSWLEGQGVTIPLEHHEAKWSPEELNEIYDLFEKFLADRQQPKVGQNIQFDIRFLMNTKGFTEFEDNRDTKIAYYLIVSQKVDTSKRLSDIAYELTDMGGYDEPLEQYKKQYKENYIARKKAEIDAFKEAEKERVECEFKIAMDRYKQEVKEAKLIGKPTKSIIKPVKEKVVVPKKSDIKLINEIDGGNFNYDWIPLEIMHPYASGDVDCCLRIYNVLYKRIEEHPKMLELWLGFYPRLTATLAHIEASGVLLDSEYAELVENIYTEEEHRLLNEIRKLPEVKEVEDEHMMFYKEGLKEMTKPVKDRDASVARLRDKYKITDSENKVHFKPSSSEHKGRLLFKVMGLTLPYDKESIKKETFDNGVPEHQLTWRDYKTDKHALAYIAENYPEAKHVAELLLEYSKVNTLKNNFAQKLPKLASNKDGMIHGSYNSTGTESTRLSANNPNMQQLSSKVGDPRRFDYKYPIKRLFRTRFEGGGMLQLDYSALEMRILGLIAKDKAMTQAFINGEDMHEATASLVWKLPKDNVPKDMRQRAKSVNFGIAYGKHNCRLVA